MCGDAVRDGVDLAIGVALAVEDHGVALGGALCLAAEKSHHVGPVVVFLVIVVEPVEQGHLCLGGNVDVGETLARQ